MVRRVAFTVCNSLGVLWGRSACHAACQAPGAGLVLSREQHILCLSQTKHEMGAIYFSSSCGSTIVEQTLLHDMLQIGGMLLHTVKDKGHTVMCASELPN